jgi:signal transduction histidine kinase
MTPVIDAAIERLRDKIDRRGVTVEVEANLPAVQGQIIWLEEIFTNLIDNAVKYIGASNLQPKIAIRGRLENNDACFEVQDNGIGIAPEAIPTLFTMFSRLNPAEAEGTGLGLSIVRQIVEKLNGSISVESVPGSGSTFRITLPAVCASVSTLELLLNQAVRSAAE